MADSDIPVVASTKGYADGKAGELRVSERTTKGVPPERLGFPPGERLGVSGNVQTRQSQAPTTSTPLTQQGHLSSVSGLEVLFRGASFETRRSPKGSMRSFRSSMASSAPRRAALAKEIEDRRKEAEFKREIEEAELATAQIKLKAAKEKLEDQKEIAELEKQLMEEDSDSQKLGSDDEDLDIYDDHRPDEVVNPIADQAEPKTLSDNAEGAGPVEPDSSDAERKALQTADQRLQSGSDSAHVSIVTMKDVHEDEQKYLDLHSENSFLKRLRGQGWESDTVNMTTPDQRCDPNVQFEERVKNYYWERPQGKGWKSDAVEPFKFDNKKSDWDNFRDYFPRRREFATDGPILATAPDENKIVAPFREDRFAPEKKMVSFPDRPTLGSDFARTEREFRPAVQSTGSIPVRKEDVSEKLGQEYGSAHTPFPHLKSDDHKAVLLQNPKNRAHDRMAAKDSGNVVPPRAPFYPQAHSERPQSRLKWTQPIPSFDNVPLGKSRSQGMGLGFPSNAGRSSDQQGVGSSSQQAPGSALGQERMDRFERVLTNLIELEGLRTTQSYQQKNNSMENSDTKVFMARQTTQRDLPIYSGEPEDWAMFRATFDRTTAMCQFSDEENLSRLQKALRGPAKEAVSCLMTTPRNVPEILSTLEEQFGQPRMIISRLVEKARHVTPVREDKPETWTQYTGAIRTLVASMTNLRCRSYMNSPMLMDELVDKLPPIHRFHWATHVEAYSSDPTLEDLSTWATKQAKIASMIKMCPKVPDPKSSKNKEQSKSMKKPPDTILTVEANSSAEQQKVPKNKKCYGCKKDGHYLGKCPDFKEKSINDRWKLIREKNLCFGCLNIGHSIKDCKSKRKCGRDGCESLHHGLLHDSSRSKKSSEAPKPETIEEEQKAESATVSTLQIGSPRRKVLLRITPVIVRGPKGEVEIFALFDDGANCSLIDQTVADQIGLQGRRDPLTINLAHGKSSSDAHSERVSFEVADPLTKEFHSIHNARTIRGLELTTQTVDVPLLRKRWSYLLDKRIQSYENARPLMIIGMDNYHLIAPREIVDGPPNAPVMTSTKLGWLVHGNMSWVKRRSDTSCVYHVGDQKQEDDLHQLVQDYFSIEALGVRATPEVSSAQNQKAKDLLYRSTSRKGNKYYTGLLWKKDVVSLPESRSLAERRLLSMERRMDRDPIFAKQYCEKIDHFFQKNYAKIVKEGEIDLSSGKFWVLPHFAVITPRKPGKLRIVFDCAARSHGVSLNEELLTGPDLLISLNGNLFAFRSRRFAVSGDIREMYLQIKMNPEDLAAQCFLWRGMRRDVPPQLCVMTSLLFGLTSAPCSAQHVKNENAKRFSDQYPEAVRAIIEKHYMDNYNDSFDTEEEALTRCSEVFKIHKAGGFEMCNWNSNSKRIMDGIPEELRSKGPTHWILNHNTPTERILGLEWDPTTDQFRYDLGFYHVRPEILDQRDIPTKREVSSVVMGIYDSLGLISNLTISGRVLIQEIWKSKIEWSEKIKEDLWPLWGEFLQNIEKIRRVRIPRCYVSSPEKVITRQIHLFSDASARSYGANAYLRTGLENSVEVTLIMAKSRVVPLKPTTLTIPRLELEAALLSARLVKTVTEGHDFEIDQVVFWTDSQVVLNWINSDRTDFQVFVGNRVGQILELTKPDQWRFVPTKLNSADIATRSKSDVDPKFWFSGPDFLKWPEEHWPKRVINEVDPDVLEFKRTKTVNAVQEVFNSEWFRRYSKHIKLVRQTARLMRVRTWKRNTPFNHLSIPEIQAAQLKLEQIAQRESFPEYFQRDAALADPKGRLFSLSPFIDDQGLLRVRGRLQKSEDATPDTKHPIILDPRHIYTKLLISRMHEEAMHQGKETVLNNLKQKYHVINGRQAVKEAFRNCQWCKIQKSKPAPPFMAPLPEYRVTKKSRPFAVTGVDFFGPIEITVGRRHEKRWGVLFTCLTIRAIHVEVAASLSADSCIQALRRFIARRGNPEVIWSDNGTNFKGASGEMQLAIQERDHEKIRKEATNRGIDWKFIPPYSPHMGGCWERLIGSVKRALKAVLFERYPHEETLHTFLTEAEAIVNKHPLTHVPLDSADGAALTPMDFLLVSCLEKTAGDGDSPGRFDDDEFRLRRQWRIAQRLADQFWKRWVHEYLPVLNRRGKWLKSVKRIQVGDQIIIADDDADRNQWERARVIKVHPGEDGEVRVATVETASGKIYKRPVVKLCILDLENSDEGTPSSGGRMSSRMPSSPSNADQPMGLREENGNFPSDGVNKDEEKENFHSAPISPPNHAKGYAYVQKGDLAEQRGEKKTEKETSAKKIPEENTSTLRRSGRRVQPK